MLFLQRHLHVIVRNGFNFLIHVFMLVNCFCTTPTFQAKMYFYIFSNIKYINPSVFYSQRE